MKTPIENAQSQLMIEVLERKLFENYDEGFMLRQYCNIAPNDIEAENRLNQLIEEKNELEHELKMIKQ